MFVVAVVLVDVVEQLLYADLASLYGRSVSRYCCRCRRRIIGVIRYICVDVHVARLALNVLGVFVHGRDVFEVGGVVWLLIGAFFFIFVVIVVVVVVVVVTVFFAAAIVAVLERLIVEIEVDALVACRQSCTPFVLGVCAHEERSRRAVLAIAFVRRRRRCMLDDTAVVVRLLLIVRRVELALLGAGQSARNGGRTPLTGRRQ